jgi:type I restriction enzyme, S subunit
MDKDDVVTQQIINNQKMDYDALSKTVRKSLPSHWQEVRMGDICHIKTSFPSFKLLEKLDTKSNADELVLALKVSDMNSPANQRYLTEAKQAFRYSREEIKKGRLLRPGSIVFPKRGGAIGTNKKRITKYYSLLDPNLIGIEPSDEVDGEYLLGFFDRFDLRTLQDNNPIPQLNKNDVEAIILPLPPLSEQHTIVKVLLTVQDAIQTRRDELELELERKAALMEYLFTHGTSGETTKLTEIGGIPQSWQFVRLGEVCNIRYGLGQPPTLDNNGVPMIRATDIKGGRIVSSTVIRVKRDAIPEKRNPFLKRGDIIVVRSGAYTGDVAIYDGRWELAIAGYDLVVTSTNDEIDMAFMTQYFLGNSAQNYFRSQRDRSAQPHLNADQLSNTVIPLPSLQEQQLISQTLNACDAKISTLEQEVTLFKELFRALLEELITGRLSTLPLIGEGETHE